MKFLALSARLFVAAAVLGFIGAVIVKIVGGAPVAFGLYPRSFMSFSNTCLLFAIALLLMQVPAKKK